MSQFHVSATYDANRHPGGVRLMAEKSWTYQIKRQESGWLWRYLVFIYGPDGYPVRCSFTVTLQGARRAAYRLWKKEQRPEPEVIETGTLP